MNVFFYVNGLPRLIMACAIADEYFAGCRRHLILLNQHGYRYDALLPKVRHNFSEVLQFRVSYNSYSHWRQFFHTYLDPFPSLRGFFKPDSTVVLFDISSPVQKFIVRRNKRLGNRVVVFAESLAVDRCFVGPDGSDKWRGIARMLLPRAFAYQHDYDVFYVHNTAIYENTPYISKLRPIAGLYQSASFARYATLLTAELPIEKLQEHDCVFLGQPLSNFDAVLDRAEEESMLHDIIGKRRALILPHPNERLEENNKYSGLKGSWVFRSGLPNELLLLRLRPKLTMTFASTMGINYASMVPDSKNIFYPISSEQLNLLRRYAAHLPNVEVDDRFIARSGAIGAAELPNR